jgi:hypothetical protein
VFTLFVLTYWLGLWGIPVAAGIAYLVFRKRESKAVRKIAFAIGILLVIGGSAWLAFDVINNML